MLDYYLQRTEFRSQVLIVVANAVVTMAIISSLINVWDARQHMRDYLATEGRQITANLARQSVLYLQYQSTEFAVDVVETALAFPDVENVALLDATGHVLFSKNKNADGKQVNPTLPLLAVNSRTAFRAETETFDGWWFIAPVFSGKTTASPFEMKAPKPQLLGYVQIVIGKVSLNRLALSLLLWNAGIMAVLAIILLAFLGLVTGRIVHPLNTLSALMERAKAGESGIRANFAEGPRDIVEMANAFNMMMEVIDHRNEEKNSFLAMISHELNTPLQIIVSSTETLNRRNHDTRLTNVILRMTAATSQLETQMKDLTDYARLDSGKLGLHLAAFNPGQILEKLISHFLDAAKKKDMHISFDSGSSTVNVNSDANRFQQIAANLITNAIKYSGQGSNIAVKNFVREDHPAAMTLTVEDTGPGIPLQHQETIFKPFTQLDQPRSKPAGGAGMGLAIVSKLVELLGGTIKIYSHLGHGTRFEVTIPVEIVHGQQNPPALSHTTFPDTSRRVLLVDDDKDVLDSIRDMVEEIGYVCDTSSNSDEALEKIRKKPYSAILLDIQMPGLDGFGLAAAIRQNAGPNQAVPVIAISAFPEHVSRKQQLEIFTHYLTKGAIRREDLWAVLDEVIETDLP